MSGWDYKFTANDLNTLTSIHAGTDITSMELLNEWLDDRIPCADAKINGVTITFLWCGAKVVGALEITDSVQAKDIICENVHRELGIFFEELFDGDPEEIDTTHPTIIFTLGHLRSLKSDDHIRIQVSKMIKQQHTTTIDPDTFTVR